MITMSIFSNLQWLNFSYPIMRLAHCHSAVHYFDKDKDGGKSFYDSNAKYKVVFPKKRDDFCKQLLDANLSCNVNIFNSTPLRYAADDVICATRLLCTQELHTLRDISKYIDGVKTSKKMLRFIATEKLDIIAKKIKTEHTDKDCKDYKDYTVNNFMNEADAILKYIAAADAFDTYTKDFHYNSCDECKKSHAQYGFKFLIGAGISDAKLDKIHSRQITNPIINSIHIIDDIFYNDSQIEAYKSFINKYDLYGIIGISIDEKND